MRTPWVKIGGNGDVPFWRMIMPMAFKLWMTFNANVSHVGPNRKMTLIDYKGSILQFVLK